jgi:hypothetical protein
MKAHKSHESAGKAERKEKEDKLDEALEESFPASDPLPTTRTSAGGPEDHKPTEKAKAR